MLGLFLLLAVAFVAFYRQIMVVLIVVAIIGYTYNYAFEILIVYLIYSLLVCPIYNKIKKHR